MIEFNISAPGRIILSGDHAAMYEKHVVMASLDRRTKLKFCELPDEQGIIKIEFCKVDLSLEVPLQKVRNLLIIYDKKDMISNIIRLLNYVKHFIAVNGMWRTHEQRFSLQLFFLLLYSIAYNEKLQIRPFHVNVSTELSIGLGSSTSFAVCLAACFIHWARLQKGAHDELDQNDLEKISRYTTLCEQYIQDYAFGFDNNVCIYGKIQSFQYSNFECYIFWSRHVPGMKILLIDAKISQNNRERLQRMAKLKHICPNTVEYILRKIDAISQQIYQTLYYIAYSHGNPNSPQEAAYAQLQEYIQKNQKILYDSGLSHPRLDDICSIAESYGFAGKLTGFGGGFVYIPLPPSIAEERITNLWTKLEAEGFNVTTTSVSCSGVRIDD